MIEFCFSVFFGKVEVGEMCETFNQMSCHIIGVGKNFAKLQMFFF